MSDFPRASELPWFGLGVLAAAAVGVHLLGGVFDWLARPSARSPSVPIAALAPVTPPPAAVVVPVSRPPVVSVAPLRPAPPIAAAPNPMLTASARLPEAVAVARLQGWLAYQKSGGRMPPDLAQRLTSALQVAERVKRGYELTPSEDTALQRNGVVIVRRNNAVTVEFYPEAIPLPPTALTR